MKLKISLEFFTRKRKNWPLNFQSENIPWEIWTIKIDLMQLSNENGIKKELYDAWSRVLLQRGFTLVSGPHILVIQTRSNMTLVKLRPTN